MQSAHEKYYINNPQGGQAVGWFRAANQRMPSNERLLRIGQIQRLTTSTSAIRRPIRLVKNQSNQRAAIRMVFNLNLAVVFVHHFTHKI